MCGLRARLPLTARLIYNFSSFIQWKFPNLDYVLNISILESEEREILN
jgi:hypothetical protein